MLVSIYDTRSSRRLAASIVAGAASPLHPGERPGDTRVIETGGGWHLSTWRESIRRLADRGRVTALAMRTTPTERQLPDAAWAQVARSVAGWVGVADRPWAAVRIGPTTVALLTDAASGPLSMDAARELARTLTTRYRLQAAAQLPNVPDDGATTVRSTDDQAAPTTPSPHGVARLSFPASSTAGSDIAAAPPPAAATVANRNDRPQTGPDVTPGTNPTPGVGHTASRAVALGSMSYSTPGVDGTSTADRPSSGATEMSPAATRNGRGR